MQQIWPRDLYRRSALLALVALVLALSGTNEAPAAGGTVTARNGLERTLLERINDVRAAHGLRPLSFSSALNKAATRHVNSMAAAGYFRHELYTPRRSDDWTGFSTWIRWYWPGPDYSSWSAGENLAWGAPSLSARQAVRRWMDSPPHRANLLTAGWRRVGLAAVQVSNPDGYFGDWSDVTIVVAEFGRRS
jgi:uncharacterized protein YkwD